MSEKFFANQQSQKVFLFITHSPTASPADVANAAEFKELARAGGLICESVEYQVLKKPHPGSFIGSGKIKELKEKLDQSHVRLVIFDRLLSGVQMRNLEKALAVRVMDRHQLILDIFASRARSYEGKLQVELARLMDEMPRLKGAWLSSLSRQGGGKASGGGGFGAKGPGEKALEKDRRQVQMRAKKIKQKLEKIRFARQARRAQRQKNKIPSLALIGYTNSGKSTLLNKLTQSDVPVQDLPFMTLDPTTRQIHIPGIAQVVMTDTVGFIQNLSPNMIEAFKAALEESAGADILIHVIDLSSPLMAVQINTVNSLLDDLSWSAKPCLHVYNKIDIAPREKAFNSQFNHPKIFVSAKTGAGLSRLKAQVGQMIVHLQTEQVELYFPKSAEKQIYALSRKALIQKKETSSLGTLCLVRMAPHQIGEWKKFIVRPPAS